MDAVVTAVLDFLRAAGVIALGVLFADSTLGLYIAYKAKSERKKQLSRLAEAEAAIKSKLGSFLSAAEAKVDEDTD